MLKFIGKNFLDKNKNNESTSANQPPFCFNGPVKDNDQYQYPNLYEEADEMLQVSMLIYSLTDLRTLAKDPKRNKNLTSPERILELPLSLPTCLQVLEENSDVMKECLGEADHVMTMNSLNLIHARFETQRKLASASQSTERSLLSIFPLGPKKDTGGVGPVAPLLTHFGDENAETDMVYAIGIDRLRKRITVAFRGSVTTTDFQKDAMISLNKQPNPVHKLGSGQEEKVGIHHGFYDYLLNPRSDKGTNKFEEIFEQVKSLFQEDERHKDYKLYVTGHSLGGALATLFSFHAAAACAVDDDCIIPGPVSCMSVASPRVGDRSFQNAFVLLEELGLLRHLRIANDRDPVTMMPSATGKKVWATLSPISYLAFKLMDGKFHEKESFHHTGIKLRLAKERWELSFLGKKMESDRFELSAEVFDDSDAGSCASSNSRKDGVSVVKTLRSLSSSINAGRRSTRQDSFNQSQLPDVSFHLGNAYIENLASVKNDLMKHSLNSLYETKASSIFLEMSV